MSNRGPTFLTVLEEVRRRWRRVAWLRLSTQLLLLAAGALLLLAIIDRLLAPTSGRLVVLAAVIAMSAAVVGAYRAWPLRRQPADRDVARLVEERCPGCEQRLVSAIDAGTSPLRPLLEKDATRVAAALDLEQVVPRARMRTAARGLALALVAVAAIGLLSRDAVIRAGRAAWFVVRPPVITVTVTPGHARIPLNDPLTIRAQISGVPRGVDLPMPELRVSAGTERRAERMKRSDGGRFELHLPKVTRGFTYQVAAGSIASGEYRVEALPRPRVTRVVVDYTYPSFTGLAPRVVDDSGDVYAPAGTEIRLRVHTNKSLAAATFVRTDAKRTTPMRVVTDTVAETAFTLDRNGAYRVALRDRDGLSSPGDTEFFLRVVDDRPPEVRIVRPEGDRTVTRLEEVAIEARADDDYGIDEFELVYAVRGEKERRIALAGAKDDADSAGDRRGASVTGGHTLFLEELDVQPGDFVSYYARAVDVGRGKRPTEARSDIFFLEVRPFAEEFAAAQSQAMAMAGGGGGLKDLAAAQKDLIIATWKLERRANGGQSTQDIRALGRAQAELRDQAAQQAARASFGGLRRQRDGDDDDDQAGARLPIARAVEAMSRAAEALSKQQTSAALPHEMEAYNQLLRAGADVQRRLVARQQGGGRGGGRSGTEDLSALFDRELLREQTTNYAQQSTASQASESRESSALERLRELARRQDDLARAQRELARNRARTNDEEVKRHLERLTREQEELERQARELARELDEQRTGGEGQEAGQSAEEQESPSASGGRAADDSAARRGERGEPDGDQRQADATRDARAGAGGLTEAMRRALEDMRQATRGLRDADVGAAASRSERSLARLREAERALGGSSPRRDEASEKLSEQLARAQDLRKRLAEIDQRLSAESGLPGRSSPGRGSPEASEGRQSGGSNGGARDKLAALRAERDRLLREAQSLVDNQGRGSQEGAAGGGTPERQEFSRSAPGTEAFKQDFSEWDALRKDVITALEALELSLSEQLAERDARNRLNAGGDERTPERYSESVARYYRSIARKPGPGE
ncbi:MAG: DUF4175 family protein [Luteitalea sp.]|nr:DUF4175 family protein [Luteitalea sp.]